MICQILTVWIALTVPDHVHHKAAKQYWTSTASPHLAFVSHTALGFVRIISQLPSADKKSFDSKQAWHLLSGWLADNSVRMVPEPAETFKVSQKLAEANSINQTGWSDAYLASISIASGMRLVSFDRDFTDLAL